MTLRRWMLWTALLTVGCQAAVPTQTTRSTKGGGTKTGPVTVLSSAKPTPAAAGGLLRVAPPDGVAVELIGKVKLISDNGGGIISNNAGALISDNGGGLISDHGGGLVSNNSGSLRVLQAAASGAASGTAAPAAGAAPVESLLADATLEVLDAEGNVLADADKKPLTATTDKTGAYRFKATLPKENLVIRVKLWNGGTLQAILPKADPAATGAAARTVDVDTASTLGAAYVLEKYVLKKKDVFDRLPAKEAADLQAAMEAARAKLGAKPSYKTDELVAQAESLKGQVDRLNQTLEHIKSLLVLGQKDLGAGLLATQVPLSNTVTAFKDAQGNMFVAERIGRIRKVDAATGKIALYAGIGPGGTAIGQLDKIGDMIGAPDGTIYIAEHTSDHVKKITPDGQMSLIAGGGSSLAPTGKATDAKLSHPDRLALGPDGSLYVAEAAQESATGRVLRLKPDGTYETLPCLGGACGQGAPFALAVGPDGAVYAGQVAFAGGVAPTAIVKLAPGATAWETLYTGGAFSTEEHMALGPDGSLYVASGLDNKILKLSTTASNATIGPAQVFFAGTEQTNPYPRSIWVDANGTVLVASGSDSVVRAITPAGDSRPIAGTTSLTQVGDALGLAINTPGGLALDPQGRLLISENTTHTIKRLDGNAISLLSGLTAGYADGPAKQARFNSPTGMAYIGDDLYVLDVANRRVRKMTADGTVSTVAGAGMLGTNPSASVPAAQAAFGRMMMIVVDPDGQPVFSDVVNSQVLRLTKDGQVQLVAGSLAGANGLSGDGGPATAALMDRPGGLAYDKAGNLYVAEFGSFVIRKIAPDGTISTFAGIPQKQALGRLLGAQVDAGPVQAKDALFVGPSALCVDDAGNLYVAELGSALQNLVGDLTGGKLPVTLPYMPARVRKIAPDGTVTIVAGPGGKVLTDPKGDDALFSPANMLIDGQGRLVIADTGANQVKILPKGAY